MGRLRWYKRDPVAALDGMSELSLEERGAYNTVLDLIYARDGQVDDDDRFISGWLRCDIRVWRRIKARLIERGKLYVKDGSIRNERADVEVLRGLHMLASASEAGKASARSRRDANSKNNEIEATSVATDLSTNSTTTTRKKNTSLVVFETNDDWPSDYRERFWAEYPRRVGKQGALRELDRVRKRGVKFGKLITAVKAYASTADPQYTKHPQTWLSKGCWDDELPMKSTAFNNPLAGII